MLCEEHTTYHPGCSACARTERVNSAYSHAFADVQQAAAVLAQGVSHKGKGTLTKAAWSLNAYLAALAEEA